jgi:hypothetical protein
LLTSTQAAATEFGYAGLGSRIEVAMAQLASGSGGR